MTDASKFYKIEGEKVVRTHRTCPKCGTAVFMGDHYDRWVCGKCGYTVFKRKGKKTTPRTRRRSPRKRSKST
ncbi:MAG: 30S ribosomal protein S27ae [Promethearchaeati archaeon]|nr:MAG: 30S ribosomal protein S27ae [Candidatus Lokiarchaeota archaeon]